MNQKGHEVTLSFSSWCFVFFVVDLFPPQFLRQCFTFNSQSGAILWTS